MHNLTSPFTLSTQMNGYHLSQIFGRMKICPAYPIIYYYLKKLNNSSLRVLSKLQAKWEPGFTAV